ncbi:hypothetical protein GGF32_007646 [Allomyces javanicus]|nr:hypothetical protein GGF32_007646 [Allomyces javanicus]
MAAPFDEQQFEGKLFTVSALARQAPVKWLDTTLDCVILMEVGLYLYTDDTHLDQRIFAATGALSFRPSSASPDSTLESYSFSFQFLADRVSMGLIAVMMVDMTLRTNGRVKDLVVGFTLSEVVTHGKPAPEPVIVPASLGYLQCLHDPDVCDCSFQVGETATLLYATRVLLIRASPYFKAMFLGDWAETQSKDPIPFTLWSAPAVALAFVHIYSGWTPNVALPTNMPTYLLADFACDPATLSFATWRQLLELAQYLGLKDLALAVNRKLMALLEEQLRELAAMPSVVPNENPRPRKRARPGNAAPAAFAAAGPQTPTCRTMGSLQRSARLPGGSAGSVVTSHATPGSARLCALQSEDAKPTSSLSDGDEMSVTSDDSVGAAAET